ncbi:MAG TPA: hypothetical protein PK233_08190 [Candidatus Atribacteria bacterium]|nr:hypothetical protein [Candidatus Atribacteria bacterium]
MPTTTNVGIALGALSALFFLIADLYVILHMLQKIFFPRSNWSWLQKMGRRWHNIHYYGNIAMVIAMTIHAILMAPYAGFFNWLFFAFIWWMGAAGMLLKFSHLSPKVKATISRFHARWYMILLVLILLVVSHLLSLAYFPYPLG